MNIQMFLDGLDRMFNDKKLYEIEPYLAQGLKQAMSEGDMPAQFTILNEMMGYFRDISSYDKSLAACGACLELMDRMGIKGSLEYATSLQNIANAHRAAGKNEEALAFYSECEQIYKKEIDDGDERYASLYNNISLVYQNMEEYDKAIEYLRKSLSIIEKIDGARIKVATTLSNLGTTLTRVGEFNEAKDCIEKSIEIFENDGGDNFHYCGALSAMADLLSLNGDQCLSNEGSKEATDYYGEAASYYEKAMHQIEINMGRGAYYNIVKQNLNETLKKMRKNKPHVKGIDLAKKFYETYGRKMIDEKFPEYADRIAVGFAGEGSEKFGFDDEYSSDHDFGPALCMWVDDETYEEIGERLSEEYDKLPQVFMGYTKMDTAMAEGRCGVIRINDFFEKYTGVKYPPLSDIAFWENADLNGLLTVTNGEVFRDDRGEFTKIRNEFSNMPESCFRIRIARAIGNMSQTGQSNYARSMGRGDLVTAKICIAKFIEQTMICAHLLERRYHPYYKWLRLSMNKGEFSRKLAPLIDELAGMEPDLAAWKSGYDSSIVNRDDKLICKIDEISKMVAFELKSQGLIENDYTEFLNVYVAEIAEKAREAETTE